MENLLGLVSAKTVWIALTAIFAAMGLWFDSNQNSRSNLFIRKAALCGTIGSFIMAVALDAADTRSNNLHEANERERTGAIIKQIGRSVLSLTRITVELSIMVPFGEYPDNDLKREILAIRDNRVNSRVISYDRGGNTRQNGFMSFFDIDKGRLNLLRDNLTPSILFLESASAGKTLDTQGYLTDRFDFSDAANVYAYVEQNKPDANARAGGASEADKWIGVENKATFDISKTGHSPDLRSILDLNGAVLSVDLFSAWFPGAGARDDRLDAQVLRSLAHGKLLSVIVYFDGYGGLCIAGDDFTRVSHEKPIDIWRSGIHVLDERVTVPNFFYRLPKDILSNLSLDIEHCLALRPEAAHRKSQANSVRPADD